MRAMPVLLVIEDGAEYEEFARLFLAERFDVVSAHSAREALDAAASHAIDAMLIDLRFERARDEDLVGDVEGTASRLFAGDRARATRWLKEQQGTLILGELRKAGHAQPAVFVHDFPPPRLANLKKLYGRVAAVPSFDASAIVRELARLA
jgi:DNA-binding NarL/FixJ family response regulator